MVYLFFGEETSAKDEKIKEIREKTILSPDALSFDYELLHASKLAPEILKKALLTLPVIAKKRLIIIRQAENLNPQNKNIIMGYLDNISEKIILILDSASFDSKENFYKKLSEKAKVISFAAVQGKNVFDMTKAIARGDSAQALKILSDLIEDGQYPLQIMGALVWSWGKAKENISSVNYRNGLDCIQKADLNIKRSRLDPQQALEILVVSLCSLAI